MVEDSPSPTPASAGPVAKPPGPAPAPPPPFCGKMPPNHRRTSPLFGSGRRSDWQRNCGDFRGPENCGLHARTGLPPRPDRTAGVDRRGKKEAHPLVQRRRTSAGGFAGGLAPAPLPRRSAKPPRRFAGPHPAKGTGFARRDGCGPPLPPALRSAPLHCELRQSVRHVDPFRSGNCLGPGASPRGLGLVPPPGRSVVVGWPLPPNPPPPGCCGCGPQPFRQQWRRGSIFSVLRHCQSFAIVIAMIVGHGCTARWQAGADLTAHGTAHSETPPEEIQP